MSPRDAGGAWYRQPVVWVGAVVLAASIAGCVWLIVVAERYADPPLPVEGLQVLTMPLTRPPTKTPRPPP
ncbi:MAG: hypothetical protein EPN62_17385 [Candidimonas sp.]|nr:MAG: hypothetical protein EPN62_17385 [Candidimonas sp.]